MKTWKLYTVLALFVIVAFTYACNTDKCETTYCLNNGVCDDGNCKCPTGYEGVHCETYVGPGGGNTSSCPITQQALSKTQILNALQGFVYDGTTITSIVEANKMLQYICAPINIHTNDNGYACGKFSNGWHITIWINTYGKANTYGVRFNQSDNHSHFSSNDTYFEISKTSGGGNCTSTPYYGPQTCANGYVAVSANLCCPASSPYLGVQTGNCYPTCDDAKNAGNTSISFGTGQTGGSGGNCISTPYYGPQNCSNSGYVAVSSSACCPASNPYFGVQTNSCYTTCEAAKSAGNTSISFGTGQTSSGGSSNCNWNALNCVQVTEILGASCGDPESIDLKIKNICNENIRVYVCFQLVDGTWPIIGQDEPNLYGLPPGAEFQVYTCKHKEYHIFAIPYATFIANNCNFPSCN